MDKIMLENSITTLRTMQNGNWCRTEREALEIACNMMESIIAKKEDISTDIFEELGILGR